MSEKAKKVSVSREIVISYIEAYYKSKYEIDETIQPNFWEAVILLCNDANVDVGALIDDSEAAQYCIKEFGTKRAPVSKIDSRIKDVNELVKNIANSICKSESAEISKLQFFLMEKRIESMEHNMKLLSGEM